MKATTLQTTAAAILMVLGAGHLALLVLFDGPAMQRWFDHGLWAAVPLELGPEPELSVEALTNTTVFWSGVGGFAFPTFVLGAVLWSLARRGITPGAWVGYLLTAWWAIFAVLLVPSPAILGVVAGLLLIVAARRATSALTPQAAT